MSLYQFLIAVRQQDGQQLTDSSGETTSHLVGMFYRTLKIVDHGIKPVYVFDGKPPDLKGGELAKRLEQREKAQKAAEELKETGTAEEVSKFERRTVKVTRQQNDEAKRLLKLMGIPYIEAPGEAEAQCAALAKAGKVFAAASEDMDTLTFGTPTLLRYLTAMESKGLPITEIDSKIVLESLELSQQEFVDMCILIGCDYLDSIKGIGPRTAYDLITKHKTIEAVLEVLKEKSKYKVPEDWNYEAARELFRNPDIVNPEEIELKWTPPDIDGLVAFLVGEKGFSEQKVRKAAEKLTKKNTAKPQGRLDSFFKVTKTTNVSLKEANKRKKEQNDAMKKKRKVGKWGGYFGNHLYLNSSIDFDNHLYLSFLSNTENHDPISRIQIGFSNPYFSQYKFKTCQFEKKKTVHNQATTLQNFWSWTQLGDLQKPHSSCLTENSALRFKNTTLGIGYIIAIVQKYQRYAREKHPNSINHELNFLGGHIRSYKYYYYFFGWYFCFNHYVFFFFLLTCFFT